jgi:hypothetical protein
MTEIIVEVVVLIKVVKGFLYFVVCLFVVEDPPNMCNVSE